MAVCAPVTRPNRTSNCHNCSLGRALKPGTFKKSGRARSMDHCNNESDNQETYETGENDGRTKNTAADECFNAFEIV